jgi:hypothetical protein
LNEALVFCRARVLLMREKETWSERCVYLV